MGNARWDDNDWRSYSSTTRSLSQNEIFAHGLKESLNPAMIQFRESCDSEANPLSTPIIVGLDVTGSMGFVATNIAQYGLGKLVNDTLRLRPVTDPHFMFMGIGDVECDRAPLQVTQFEADIRIGEQLRDLWLEKGGGGNHYESYHLPWHFAANFCRTDAFLKRRKKGFIFTVGDESVPRTFTKDHHRRVYGRPGESDLTIQQLLTAAQEKYHVFHIIAEEGSYARSHLREVNEEWRALLGQNVISMPDHTKLSELVVQAMIWASDDPSLPVASAEPVPADHHIYPNVDLS